MSAFRFVFRVALILMLTLSGLQAAFSSEKLQVVSHDKVCMVNNVFFGRPQIPVQYEGKTYYGCCENCKKTLAEDASARTAVDPLSGKSVDKAKSIIAAKEDGSVLYFESQKNFEAFRKKGSSSKN